MKEILWIIRERFIIWKNHPLQVLFLLGIPLLSIVMYLFIYSNTNTLTSTLSVGVIDQDQSIYSQEFIESLKKRVTVKEIEEEDVDKVLSEQQVSATIVLPEDFSEKMKAGHLATLRFRTFQQGEVIDSLKNIVKTSYNEILSIAKFAEGSGEKSAFDFAEGSPKLKFTSFAKDDQNKIMTIQILGFMLMMLLYQSGNFGANTIQNERRNKVYQRLMTTPVPRKTYFIGTAAFAFLAMLFEVLFTVFLMNVVFRIDIGLSAVYLIALLAVFGLVAVAWSIAIGVNSPSSHFATGVQSILFTITSLLSGALIPNEIMPEFMQKVAQITPQYWVIDAIKQLQNQHGFTAVIMNVLVLAAFVLLFFSISIYGLMKKKNIEVFD